MNPAETADVEQRRSEWKYEEVLPKSCAECFGPNAQLWPLFRWMLDRDRGLRVSIASWSQDEVISTFLRVTPDRYEGLLRPALQALRDAHPESFRRFIVPGTQHVVSGGDWNYIAGDGRRLDRWVRAMTDGDDAVWQDVDASAFDTCVHDGAVACVAELGCGWSSDGGCAPNPMP